MGGRRFAGDKALLLAHGGIDAVEAIGIDEAFVPHGVLEGELAGDIAAKPHRFAGLNAGACGGAQLVHIDVEVTGGLSTGEVIHAGAGVVAVLVVGGTGVIGKHDVLVQLRQVLIRKLARGGVHTEELLVLGAVAPRKFLGRGAQVNGEHALDIGAGLLDNAPAIPLAFHRTVRGAADDGGDIAVHLRGVAGRVHLRHDLGRDGAVLVHEVGEK